MTYTYKCSECKKYVNFDIPMGEELPKDLDCPFCSGIETLNHDFLGQAKSQCTIIPFNMQAVNKHGIVDTSKRYRKDAAIEAAE